MKKLMNKKAFTIMEMLIVVAIIAVLVAIAIPTFSSALEKAKEAADVANVRAAYAEMQVGVMVDNAKLPADETKFIDAYMKDIELNYNGDDDRFTYEVGTTANDDGTYTATITYEAKKLDGGNTYTWTIDGEKASA